MHAAGSGVGLCGGSGLGLFILVGWGLGFCLLLGPPGLNWLSSFASVSGGAVWRAGGLRLSCGALCLLGPRICFFVVVELDLFVDREGSLAGWGIFMLAGQLAGCLCRIGCGGGVARVEQVWDPRRFNTGCSRAVVLVWSLLRVLVSKFRWCFALCLFIILLVRFGLLGGHLLGDSCQLGWPCVLIVFCLFVIFIYFPFWF